MACKATIAGLLLAACGTVFAQGIARTSSAEDVGLSTQRLNRISERMKEGVSKGELPGAVVLVAREGKVAYLESFGVRDPESKEPMRADAIFRIASMTKPFTSLAIMMLAEEGKLSIADAASKNE